MTQPSPRYDGAKHVKFLHRSAEHVEIEMTLDQASTGRSEMPARDELAAQLPIRG